MFSEVVELPEQGPDGKGGDDSRTPNGPVEAPDARSGVTPGW